MTTSATQKNTLIRALIIFLALLSPIKAWSQAIEITSLDQITTSDDHYIITRDISGGTPGVSTFSGTLEAAIDTNTHMPYRITGLDAPLFETLTGTVKNLVLDEVAISDHSGNTGAIACTANDAARIYNVGILGGSVGGTENTGGLVGLLDGTARVVNCYSYATITGGTNVGGIVGNNNYASKASDIRTMVMNCMFYGDITGGTAVSPVFGGQNINNLNDGGVNTFNYYAYERLVTKKVNNDSYYNCALAIEERNLVRHEYYRLMLNSNKRLAAFYATGSVANDGQMLKWVLETADRSIANPKPYPVLKEQGYYPSIINPDISSTMDDSATVGPRKGGRLGSKTLAVTILKKSQKTGGGQTWPVSDTSDVQTTSLTLVRTDMDSARFNYNYDKVQLPYYNDVGTGNYTEGRVVTGWKITAIDGGTPGSYSASDAWGGYNFADRNCTNKDLYSESGRVFSQGAYWDVPYGVTAITIEPYWGKAAFIADKNYDVVNNGSYSRQDVSAFGTQVDGTTKFNGISVKTSINDALNLIINSTGGAGPTVYDNAIVLVGNFHQNLIAGKEPFKSGTKPFTLMSVDLDHDNEPDYSLVLHDNARSRVCPLRFDFLNVPGTAQVQKPNGSGTFLNVSIINASSWFEITNTCLIYFSQFEYENSGKTRPSPIILLGGVYDQFTSTKTNQVKNTDYLLVGGTAWFKDFANGTHSDGNNSTKHIPISVTGGDYQGFYLTGSYNQSAAVSTDNAECYISGGHFGEAAGAGQEQINGDVHWQIYNADIDNFYGGGVNSAKPIKGNVTVDIVGSHVRTYCGGPKFGDMVAKKTVTTNASWCTFGTFFGAGFGGNSYSRVKYFDESKASNKMKFDQWQNSYSPNDRSKYFDGTSTYAKADHTDYGFKGPGVAVDFDHEFFVWTSGTVGGRFFVKFVSFSLATCRNVYSNLKHCTVEGNYYGGGSLGSVADTANSVLDSCKVLGNVFGAGYSASIPSVEVRDGGFATLPSINNYSGMFELGTPTGTTTHEWKHVADYPADGAAGFDNDSIITKTDIQKSSLGSVRAVFITLQGTTVVGTETSPGVLMSGTGNVFGGGEESAVGSDTHVTLQGKATVLGNVFGGGEKGTIDHDTTVTLQGNAHVKGDVFGGGDRGPVEGNASVILK